MKKSMMNILLWIIAIILCINGCVMDSPKEVIGIGNDNTANKAYLSLSLNESRTVLPQALDQTKLTYKLVGRYNEEDHQFGEWTYSDMLAAHTELSVGLWDFTLTANDGTQDVLVGNITNRTIIGGDNPLSFTMKECSTGTGIISVTAIMPHGKVAKVEAILRDASDDTLIDSKQLSVNDCTDDSEQDYALYEINSANKGLYTLLLSLYQSASDTECINEQIMLVRVEPGCISSGTVVFEQVNTYWHIIYHFEGFDVTDDPVLVTKYNESMQIILPKLYKDNTGDYYRIGDYYNNTDRTGDTISEISYDNNEDIELWVKSKSVLVSSSSGLLALLYTLDSACGPYTIVLTDNTPDMSSVRTALTRRDNVKVNLDMADCTGLTSIGEAAFSGCNGLTGIEIPDSVTSIGDGAFCGCNGLTSVTIPDSVTSIGEDAFCGCIRLTSVTIPSSVTSIGDNAFTSCWGLTSVTIPDNVTSIGISVFYDCSGLTSVTIGNGVTSIGDHAFHDCSGLTSVTIPNSVMSIGGGAFYNCSGLTNVTIPDGVTSIGSHAFYGCSGLTTLSVKATTPPSFGSDMLWSCSKLITIYVPTSSVDAYKEAEGWSDFADKIVGIDSRLSNMVSVSELSSYIYALNSDELSEIIITDNTPDLSAIKTILQTYPEKKILLNLRLCLGLTEIQSGELDDCSSLLEMYYPSSLTRLSVPNTINKIGDYVFYNRNLISIEIPDSVTSIGEHAFEECYSLTSITVADGNTIYDSRDNCNAIIRSNTLIAGCQNTVIPNTVRSIGNSAFSGCNNLTNIEIPDSVKYIGMKAFYNCRGLTSVTIGNGVTSIGNSAFYNCSKLTTLSVKATTPPSFGSNMLYNCSALTTIYVPTASVDTYKATSGWGGFADKIEGKVF